MTEPCWGKNTVIKRIPTSKFGTRMHQIGWDRWTWGLTPSLNRFGGILFDILWHSRLPTTVHYMSLQPTYQNEVVGRQGLRRQSGNDTEFRIGWDLFFLKHGFDVRLAHLYFCLFVNTESVNVDPVPDAVNRLLLWTRKKPLSCLVYPNPSVFLWGEWLSMFLITTARS
jgi:hypothetical protein